MPSEFDLIARYFSPPTRHTALAGGDDAALIDVTPGMQLVVSTDMLVGGRHFLEDAEARGVGHKSLAVNLSDLAAMGATPRWVTLSLALPAADEAWIAAFASGFLDLAREHDVDLVGGDTTCGPRNICVQIMGEVRAGGALLRSGARPGDAIWVSGTIGDAALGLAMVRGELRADGAAAAGCIARLERPQPRVGLGRALPGIATAAIDISDGLVADLGHIAERSCVRAVIDWERIPVCAWAAARRDEPGVRDGVLAGGDDYELCFTAPPDRRADLLALSGRIGVALTEIGLVEAGDGVEVRDRGGVPVRLVRRGFDHFG